MFGCFGFRRGGGQEGGNKARTFFCCLFCLSVFFVSRAPGVHALVAVEDVGHVGLLDFDTGQVHPDGALVALDHRPPGEGFAAVARDQVPRVVA